MRERDFITADKNMNARPRTRITIAERKDAPLVLSFIRELAEFERRLDQVVATQHQLEATLFGPKPAAEVLIAYHYCPAEGTR